MDFEVKTCPKCGGEVDYGYGLAGGGVGTYRYCVEDGCDYFEKEQDMEGMPPEKD